MGRGDAADPTIGPYVSSLTGDAYALRDLPEGVVARLLAAVRGDVRARLHELARSPALGPTSVPSERDHAVRYLVLERLSLLAAREFGDARLFAVGVADPLGADLAPPSTIEPPDLDAEGVRLYRDACARLLAAHAELAAKLGPTGLAADLLRGLLPSGSRTTIVLTGSSPTFGALLSKLSGHPLAEVRHGAAALQEAGRAAGALSEKPVPSSLRTVTAPAAAQALRRVYSPPEGVGATAVISQPVRILRYDKDAAERIALALAYEGSDARVHASGVSDAFRFATAAELAEIVRAPVAARRPGDPLPRAFEASSITVELMVDGVASDALSGSRLVAPTWQQPSCRLGFETPPELGEAGLVEAYHDALLGARESWMALEQRAPLAAPYAVPLAYRLRALCTLDLRALVEIVERTCALPGHSAKHRIVWALYRAAVSAHPWLKDVVRIDATG